MARPKGLLNRDARRERVSLPMTAEEKALMEQFAKKVLEDNPEYVNTAGTATVMRQVLVDAARQYLSTQQHTENAKPLNLEGLISVSQTYIYKPGGEDGEKEP